MQGPGRARRTRSSAAPVSKETGDADPPAAARVSRRVPGAARVGARVAAARASLAPGAHLRKALGCGHQHHRGPGASRIWTTFLAWQAAQLLKERTARQSAETALGEARAREKAIRGRRSRRSVLSRFASSPERTFRTIVVSGKPVSHPCRLPPSNTQTLDFVSDRERGRRVRDGSLERFASSRRSPRTEAPVIEPETRGRDGVHAPGADARGARGVRTS